MVNRIVDIWISSVWFGKMVVIYFRRRKNGGDVMG
jgi:hypothetical protein